MPGRALSTDTGGRPKALARRTPQAGTGHGLSRRYAHTNGAVQRQRFTSPHAHCPRFDARHTQ